MTYVYKDNDTILDNWLYRKLPLISPPGYRPTYMQTKEYIRLYAHPDICFINIEHSQRTLLLQQITGRDYIKTLTNDGGDEL